MARAYSMDLRIRVLQDADVGVPSKDLAARYHVSRAWVDALKQRRSRNCARPCGPPWGWRRSGANLTGCN